MSIPAVPEPTESAAELSIRDYFEVLRRRRHTVLGVFLTVLLVGVLMAPVSKPLYRAQAKLVIPATSSWLNVVNTNNPIESMLAAVQPDSLETQMQILQSAPFLTEAEQRAHIVPIPGVLPPYVTAEALENTNVILIKVEGGEPHQVAELANAVLDLHLEKTDVARTTGLQDSLVFVQQEKNKAGAELKKAQRALIDFRRDHRIVQLTADQEAQSKEYVALQSRVGETQSNIVTTRAQIAELRGRLAKEPIDFVQEGLKENPRRAKLEEKLDELKVQRAELLQDFQTDSQRVRTLDERIAGLSRQMEAEPETRRVRTHSPNPTRAALQKSLAEQETALQGQVAANSAAEARFRAQRGLVDNLGPWEVQLDQLTHERDAAQSAYGMLADRLRDLQIREKARIRTARAIERASVPTFPSQSRKSTSTIFSVILAACLAIGAAFLQEQLDDRVNSPEDVERLSSLPTLAHVPVIGGDPSRLLASLPAKSHVAEAYRSLRSGIGFASLDAPLGRLMVTSASKGEGKTVTAVNLATAMAMDGKRVILVDADLRRPAVHHALGLPASPGLSEVLVGIQPLAAAIQETPTANLRVICAGTIPPNPAEVLGQRSVETLLDALAQQADVVLFDSPPCLPVTDALLLAGRMDGVLLVVHSAVTRKGAVKQAVKLLARARARMLGAVLNRVRHDKAAYGYDLYYYYNAPDGERRRMRHRRNGHEPEAALGDETAVVAGRRNGRPEDV
jgi:capsular exopolysaccharide synthesis family protein